MSLSGWADLEEDNDRLRDQVVDLETERDEMAATIVAQAAQINELRAQLDAKEEWTNAADLEAARAAMSSNEPRVSHAEVRSEWP